ncbi:MAG: NAD(P)H-hydrate dehydratase [Pyrinomonadaceae bacterium]
MPSKRKRATRAQADLQEIDAALLLQSARKLPELDESGDKESRGRVLVIAGSREMPGAAVLAGTAALRAGAGKLQIATPSSVAAHVGAAVPEARVFALPETMKGDADASSVRLIAEQIAGASAILVGPGMADERAASLLVGQIVRHIRHIRDATLVVDANALNALKANPWLLHGLARTPILTPHAEEMSELTGESSDELKRNALHVLARTADELRAVIALKGRETFVTAQKQKTCFVNRAGNVGLATSGSGDVLAGLVAGLAARGAEPLNAALWGVHVHALAGERLAHRVGRVGYLARELLAEIPSVLMELGG